MKKSNNNYFFFSGCVNKPVRKIIQCYYPKVMRYAVVIWGLAKSLLIAVVKAISNFALKKSEMR